VRERDTGAEAIFGGTCNLTTVAITDEAPVECGVLDAGPRLTWEKGSRAWGPPQSCYGIRTKSEDSTIPRVYEGRQDRDVILRGLAVPGGSPILPTTWLPFGAVQKESVDYEDLISRRQWPQAPPGPSQATLPPNRSKARRGTPC
jgi:hypothetical protein